MGKQHSPRERLQLFGIGFRRGAGMKALPKNVQADLDVIEGQEAGRKAYGAAMEVARLKYGAPKPSLLRTNDTTEPVVGACLDLQAASIIDPKVIDAHVVDVRIVDVEHEITPTAAEELRRDPRTAAGNIGGPDHQEDEDDT